MASDVSICNAALQLLGDDPIASLTENTRRARLCANLYEHAKEDILRSHPWNCLVTRTTLSPLAAEPNHHWNYQFAVPGDCLRILSVGERDDQPDSYEVEGRRIVTDVNPLNLRYLANKAEGYWDANLVNVMVRRMQLDLAYPITKSSSLRDALSDEFHRPKLGVLARAKSVDGQENPPEDWGDSPLIAVRG